MCLSMSLSALVALVLLFLPKIYVIVCKPEKNIRSQFTTSKDVRCHIGGSNSRCVKSLPLVFDSNYALISAHPAMLYLFACINLIKYLENKV